MSNFSQVNQQLIILKKDFKMINCWNETIKKTVIREIQEEIDVTPIAFRKMATLDFYYPDHPEGNQQVLVYLIDGWKGKPQESEEVEPKWFEINSLPFKLMWPDDFHWLPLVLKGFKVRAEFLFGGKDILRHSILAVLKSPGLTLLDLLLVLSSAIYRQKVLDRVQDPLIHNYWDKIFPFEPKEVREWLGRKDSNRIINEINNLKTYFYYFK